MASLINILVATIVGIFSTNSSEVIEQKDVVSHLKELIQPECEPVSIFCCELNKTV